ncbi:MAG: DEAD/DEAH box helicase, partial [Planctomycetota bacterium]|nr:DEAD/DEAH box helicase [Planctomycetota bacterium]
MHVDELPVASDLPRIVVASRTGAVVVSAPPGSGKTTLVPSAILSDLKTPHSSVILVQPRRLAARSVAHRIAKLQHATLGDAVGYHVRFDRCASNATQLLVVTTGILLKRLCDDIDLSGVGAVILDEFHERSVEMDTLLGYLIRLQQTLRHDLRIVVMSATLDQETMAARLGDCPVICSAGRVYPVEVHYVPSRDRQPLDRQVASVVPRACRETDGHVLVFLPGVGEILRCHDQLADFAQQNGFQLMSLYGDLAPDDQDRVLAPTDRRKIILSTNVAETSVTIDRVTAVVDCGTARQMRVNPAVGLPRLDLVPISRASADQRTGRAGRTAPGQCWRLWEKTSHAARVLHDPPEIVRSDLCQTVLQLFAWGEWDLSAFPWIDPPPVDAVADARRLLRLLGAIDAFDRVTPIGQQLIRLPTHPRLGRLILAGAERGVLREATVAAAVLTERDPFRAGARSAVQGPRDQSTQRTRSDLVDRVVALQDFHVTRRTMHGDLALDSNLAKSVLRVAEQLYRLCDFPLSNRAADPEVALMQSLLEAFPDRLVRLRPQSQDRGLLVGGRGVRLDPESRVRGAPLFLGLAIQAASGDARVTMASCVERDWLNKDQLRTVDELFFNPSRGQVESRRRTYWEDLCLDETPVGIEDLEQAARILSQHAGTLLSSIVPNDPEPAAMFRRRIQWLGWTLPELALPALDDPWIVQQLPQICYGLRSLDELKRANWLTLFQQA